MFNFTEAEISHLIVHSVGNRNENGKLILSRHEINPIDEYLSAVLQAYFFKPFKTEEYFCFDTENAENQEVAKAIKALFETPSEFVSHTSTIARHLYEVSSHPKIKSGEMYVVYFNNCVVDDEICDAVGIFKSENKDTFLRVTPSNDVVGIDCEKGININKLDKGCLIFNTEAEDGYKIAVVDKTNKGSEAVYWLTNFLNAVPKENDYYDTRQFLDLCKNFSDQVLTDNNNVTNTDKIGFLNKSYEFFDKNDSFDENGFQEEVIDNEKVAEAFREFKENYTQNSAIEPPDQFQISEDAVKGAKKFFKSVIKLDKNFHIYVHSRADFIEKGYDQNKDLRYYKLYYESEN